MFADSKMYFVRVTPPHIVFIPFVEWNNSKLKILAKLISFRLNPVESERELLAFVDKHNFDYVLPSVNVIPTRTKPKRTYSGQINLEIQ